MSDLILGKESVFHHGIVLDVSPTGFDSGSASYCSIFSDEDNLDRMHLYYSGATNGQMRNSAIGLATSKNGLQFRKESNEPLLKGTPNSFCSAQAVAPVVTKIRNRFYMIFSGKSSPDSPRKIGIAYADDPKGPWKIIKELIKPTYFWEGNDIDNGPSIVKVDNETIIVYYSSIMSPKAFDIFAILRRYPIRRIGLLKVRIRGTSSSQIEAMRFSGNPLKHLNGPKGKWNESIFCPGYVKLADKHYLFPATSIYSKGYPCKQYIGMVTSNSPYFNKKSSRTTILIDGSEERVKILPNAKSEIFLDTASPYIDTKKHRLFLYYAVADQINETWKTALTTFDLNAGQSDFSQENRQAESIRRQ